MIDPREPGEDRGFDEPETVRRAGMDYVSIPVGHEDVDDETFELLWDLTVGSECRPMLVHCASANRVGALLTP